MTEPGPSHSVKKKRVFVNGQPREIAKNVVQMVGKQNRVLTFTLNNVFDQASYYTGLSKRTLAVIQEEGSVCTPRKKVRPCNKKNNLKVDDFGRNVIHRVIEEFYLTKKTIPTCSKLLTAIREQIEFPWGQTSLRKLLKEMGYQWLKCDKRQTSVEDPAIAIARSNYLRQIRQYRQDNRNIFFLDETWIDNNLTFKKCWRSQTKDAVSTDTNFSNRLILVHAGSQGVFLNGAKFLLKVATAPDEGQKRSVHFENWAHEVFIPNLPPNSVIVIDTAPVPENKVPSISSTKREMLKWLLKNSVDASLGMKKGMLFQLIELHKPLEETFKIDQLISSHGHDVVRLPPFMCDFSPIELARAKVNRIVKNRNVRSDFSLEELEEITELAICEITTDDWCGFDDHVISLEERDGQNNGFIEDTVDQSVIKVEVKAENSNTDSEMFVIFDT